MRSVTCDAVVRLKSLSLVYFVAFASRVYVYMKLALIFFVQCSIKIEDGDARIRTTS